MDILYPFLGEFSDQAIDSHLYQVVVYFLVRLTTKRHLFRLIIPQSPVVNLPAQTIANFANFLIGMFSGDSNPYLIFYFFRLQKFESDGFHFVKEMDHWKAELCFFELFEHLMIKRHENNWKILFLALTSGAQTYSQQDICQFFD